MTEELQSQLHFLTEADKMKSVYRQTLLTDKSRAETDAEHSWHFALMAMTLYPYAADKSVNLDRVLKMALVHDLVEVYAGDTFAYDAVGYEDKAERENAAADRLFGLLPAVQAQEYRSLWEEFDAMQTPDALYASAIDRLQPFINNVKTHGHTWVQHGVTADKIYIRMAPVREALPELWSFVEDEIQSAIEKGYIKQPVERLSPAKEPPLGYIMNLRNRVGVGHMPLIVCSAYVIVENAAGELLFQRRRDNGLWGFAGGSLELDESLEDCAKRELEEETGLKAQSLQFLEIFSGYPRIICPNGDELQTVIALYVCDKFYGRLEPQASEVTDLQWFAIDRLPEDFTITPPDRKLLYAYLKKRNI
jgi:putative hydrolase of HD superfamily